MENTLNRELIKKYLWAGKIRFISAVIFFTFLFLLKFLGGYSYLNPYLISLLLVEAFLNQPYKVFLKRVGVFRFQFYQILIDLIVISWFIYYLGGLEAKVVSLGYYAVILWAGFLSGVEAVIFATLSSALLFSFIVLGSFFRFLPSLDFFKSELSWGDTFSFLFGNLAFIFAFGYFSAKSASLIKELERQRVKNFLNYNNKLLVIGHLLSGFVHETINHLLSIRGYIRLLYEKYGHLEELRKIEEQEAKIRRFSSGILGLSQDSKEEFLAVSPSLVIEEALELVFPLLRMYNIKIEKRLEAKKEIFIKPRALKEVFVSIILELTEEIGKKGLIRIVVKDQRDYLEIIFEKVKKGVSLKREEKFSWRREDLFSFKKEGILQVLSQLQAELREKESSLIIRLKRRSEESFSS